MVVTRKVRTGKKDEPSTSAEGEDQPEKVLPDVSESEHEGQPDDIQDEDMENVENIKEELEKTTEDLGSGKRVSKPTFKVKYSGTKQPGNFQFSTSKILCLPSYAIHIRYSSIEFVFKYICIFSVLTFKSIIKDFFVIGDVPSYVLL